MANKQVDSEAQSPGIPLEDLQAFAEVYERISTDYVDVIDDKSLIEGAISGMLSSLDPHSAYLPPVDAKEMEEHTRGEFGGLGMEVGMEDGFVKVVSPIDDTPAQRAGIMAGDLIVKLGNEPVKGKSLSEAVDIMRGKPGTQLELTIVRKGEDKPLKIELTRAIIKVRSVRQRMLPEGIGYVRISQFQMRTGPDLIKAIDTLEEENKGELSGLVLDLRNNPGGVLNAAIQVSDAFLNDGLIVYTEGRIRNSQMRFEAEEGDVMDGKPVVIIVNEGSASASEIVSGALQDQKRAIVVGRDTFGKGSVQTLLQLNNNAAIKLTTARYFTPNGRSIQAEGIKPDVEIERVKVEKVEESAIGNIKEKDLAGHLESEQEAAEEKSEESAENKAMKETQELLDKDFELNEALRVAKTMILAQKMQK
ncbi:S41 family peptidase [Thiomicrorhabdus indica]|uniref:S41 family peptidase n=1 Tax=Thiomicrorhabdus indica TaxID=2267253 RepID=UPI00398442BF